MNWPPSEPLEHLGYDEFACSELMARFLINGGMTIVNERPVYLQHMDTLQDGRWIIHVWPQTGEGRLAGDPPLRMTVMVAA